MSDFQQTITSLNLLHTSLYRMELFQNAHAVKNVKTDVISLISRLEAVERERDELREQFDKLASAAGWSKEQCEQVGESPFDTVEGLKNAVMDHHHSLIKAEKELKRRDAAADEVIYQFDCGEGWQDVDQTDYERYINARGISTRKVYTAAAPAVLPPERVSLNNGVIGFDEGYNQCRADALALGAQQQNVVELYKRKSMEVISGQRYSYVLLEDLLPELDAAGVKWEVKK